jgi:hypothetical protein
MFILADFRKNNICGDSLETSVYRKKLTFRCSQMEEYCNASKLKEGRNREYKVCLSERTILRPQPFY